MNSLKLIPFVLLMFLLGCTSGSDSKCSDASNINKPECQKQITDVDVRPVTLEIAFKDSYFFDQNSQEWKTILKDNLTGGIAGMTLPIYSDFLNITTKTAMSKILLAKDQFERPAQYANSDYNRVPYFEVAYEDTVDYIYSYTKTDENGNVVFEKQGSLVVQDNRAILPLINETFDGQFYAAANSIGSRFTHSIAVAAQSKDKQGARTSYIVFETLLEIPNTDFYVRYADDVKAFTLNNRFKYFFNGTDNQPNTRFHFMTIKELKDIPEQIPLDFKLTFQEPPKVKMTEEVFFENPFDLSQVKSGDEVIPQRGYEFYTRTMNLDSSLDFKMALKINGQDVTLTSGREAEIPNLPAATPWDIEVYYDFTQNPLYTFPDGSPLITPLRPVCHQMSQTPYSPLSDDTLKKTTQLAGGYYSTCHVIDQAMPKIISSTNLSTDPLASYPDTFFGHFSYVPYNMFQREVGHFYGIKRITYSMSGCLKIEIREPGTVAWQIKSKSHPACAQVGGPTNHGWVYFYAEKTSTIFENMNDYEGYVGLKPLIQSFGNRVNKQTSNFKFNGKDILNSSSRKIY